jgi:hypothetical protein
MSARCGCDGAGRDTWGENVVARVGGCCCGIPRAPDGRTQTGRGALVDDGRGAGGLGRPVCVCVCAGGGTPGGLIDIGMIGAPGCDWAARRCDRLDCSARRCRVMLASSVAGLGCGSDPAESRAVGRWTLGGTFGGSRPPLPVLPPALALVLDPNEILDASRCLRTSCSCFSMSAALRFSILGDLECPVL